MIYLNNAQFKEFDGIARDRLFSEIHLELADIRPDLRDAQIQARLSQCREQCEIWGAETDYSIWCFCVLSFEIDQLLSATSDFQKAHAEYIEKYGSADQLPIDILEVGVQCSGS